MSIWNGLFRRNPRPSRKVLKDVLLCDRSHVAAVEMIRVDAYWGNELTERFPQLEDKLLARLGVYWLQDGRYVAEQSIVSPAIFMSSDEMRQAVNSVPDVEEVQIFDEFESAIDWLKGSPLLKSERVQAEFEQQAGRMRP